MSLKLKYLLWLVLITTVFMSCTEKSRNIDTLAFNKRIGSRLDIKTPTDLICTYDPRLKNARPEELSFTVTTKLIYDNRQEITAIMDVKDDDAVMGEKIIMIAERKNQHWVVSEIRYNWKNRPGYGHEDWGI